MRDVGASYTLFDHIRVQVDGDGGWRVAPSPAALPGPLAHLIYLSAPRGSDTDPLALNYIYNL